MSRTVNPDWSIDLALEYAPDGIYSDQVILPPTLGGAYDYLNILRGPPGPREVQVWATAELAPDDTVHSLIHARWAATPNRTRIVVSRVNLGITGAPFTFESIIEGNSIEIPVPFDGSFFVRIWHIDKFNILSKPWSKIVYVDWDALGIEPLSTRVNRIINENPAFQLSQGEIQRAIDAAIAAAEQALDIDQLLANAIQSAEDTIATARDVAEAAAASAKEEADRAEAEAIKAGDSATAADGSAMAAAGSATTSRDEATASANSATSSASQATAAAASASAAGNHADAASTHAMSAQSSATDAGTEAQAAQTSRVAAESAQSGAEAAEAAAESAETKAAESATLADGSARSAASSLSSIGTSASNAAGSATAAAQSASTAASSASAASQSASAAEASKTAAETARASAETAASRASTAETNADGSASASATSASAASASATAAKGSEDAAASSESDAQDSATAAANSASTAATQAQAASASASGVGTSASNAATSASNAATSASNAATSASNAATSATGAANSASAAQASATTATARATEAGSSATTAKTDASNAKTDAATAGTAATNAATSATNADGSATAAAASATAAAASAKTASDTAMGIGASVTAAAASAQTASAAATTASEQAAAAATSATNAATSEANAATSSTAAAASVTTAEGASSSAQTAQKASAGFAEDARKAVAGISATVAAEIDSELQTTFASSLAIRAVADDAIARLELVALSDPTGSRAAGIFTGDLQSFEYAPVNGTIPGIKARIDNMMGFTFVSKLFRDDDNDVPITLRKQWSNTGNPRVSVTGGSAGITITIISVDGGSAEIVPRSRVTTAVNNYNSSPVTARGDGDMTIDFSDLNPGGSAVQIIQRSLKGGKDARKVEGGAGWILKRDGSAEFDKAAIRGDLTADVVDFNTATVRGTLSAGHIDSDVRNWYKLWTGTTTVNTTVRTWTFADPALSTLDAIYMVGYDAGRSSNRLYSSSQIRVANIPNDTTPSLANSSGFGFLEFGEVAYLPCGKSGNTLYVRASASADTIIATEIWGLLAPSS